MNRPVVRVGPATTMIEGPRCHDADVAATLDGVAKTFGSVASPVRAVDDLTLDLRRGEVLGFLGANGAGKSTTMKMLAGILTPTSGRVRVLGGDPSVPATRRSIGYLPGDLALPPSWTGVRALDLFAGLRGSSVDWRSWCDRLEYDPTRPLGTLSTGNRRKLGVIQAFMCRPEVLLLDEPTLGLDPFLQRTFDELVREARARGAAILLSSHVLPEVERSADRIAVIHSGRLVRLGTIDELRNRTEQRLELVTVDPVPDDAIDELRRIVSTVSFDGDRRVVVTVAGAVQPVLTVLAASRIERVTPLTDGLDRLLEPEPEGDNS